MAGLRHWYIGQLVTAQEMRGGDTALEQGIFDMATDLGFVGLIDGGAVVEHAGTPNMTVDVAALLARSPLGERIRVAGTAVVNCAFDYLTQPTAVTVAGNSRFVDVYVVFDRVGSDPRIDATNTTVYFVQEESFAFEIHQGAEAPSPAAPIGPSDGVLLARITRTFGQTTIVNADIDTTVKESVVKIASNAISIEAGTFVDALQLLLDELVTHIDGAGAHPASAITYAGGSAWVNGTTNPSTTVEVQLDKIVTDLSATTSGDSGLHKIGAANSSAWADGTSYVAGNAFARVDGIITSLASGTTSSSGARKVGIEARSNWLGGRTNPAITSGGGTWAAIEKIISDLGATNSTDDGMERIGGAARASTPNSLTAGSAASQATELLGFANSNTTRLNELWFENPFPQTDAAPTFSTGSTSPITVDFTSFSSAVPPSEDVAVGDQILITFTTTAQCTGAQDAIIFLAVKQPSDGTPVEITGSRVRVIAGVTVPVSLNASFTVTEAGALEVYVRANKKVLGGTIDLVEAYRLEARRIRA